MTKPTLLAIAAFAAAIASTAKSLAGEAPDTANTGAEQPPAGEPTTKRRGRPANTETPATPPAEPAPATGKPESELREAIKSLVEDGRGEEVKKAIAAHGGTKLSDLPPANHAAFLRDIEALKM